VKGRRPIKMETGPTGSLVYLYLMVSSGTLSPSASVTSTRVDAAPCATPAADLFRKKQTQ
jgi:hypothetical protein